MQWPPQMALPSRLELGTELRPESTPGQGALSFNILAGPPQPTARPLCWCVVLGLPGCLCFPWG